MGVHVRRFSDPRELDLAAAEWVGRYLRSAEPLVPEPVLGLATGSTPEGMYQALVALHRAGEITFARARTFNLDEYVGLTPDHPQSYAAYMRLHLFDPVGFPLERAHLPDGAAPDPDEAARRYEALLARFGPIHAQVLGIGTNGHIGFNEPGTPFERRTHAVDLAEETRRANSRFFDDPADVPTKAITMGIANILEAGEILLLAKGAAKAQALARALQEKPSPEVPASALQLHPRVTVYADEEAARLLGP